jgi:hypothetical protein
MKEIKKALFYSITHATYCANQEKAQQWVNKVEAASCLLHTVPESA